MLAALALAEPLPTQCGVTSLGCHQATTTLSTTGNYSLSTSLLPGMQASQEKVSPWGPPSLQAGVADLRSPRRAQRGSGHGGGRARPAVKWG